MRAAGALEHVTLLAIGPKELSELVARAGLAQAFVSLGANLLKDQAPVEKAAERYKEALPLLEAALGHDRAAGDVL